MADKIVGPSSVGGNTHSEVTTTEAGGKAGLDVSVQNFPDNVDVTVQNFPAAIPSGSILDGIEWDNVAVTYPTTTQEVYTFSESAVTVATITVDFVDATKDQVSNVART